MPIASRSLKQLFLEALAVPPAERAAWLSRECPDTAVREQIELMLAAHDAPQSLLDRVAPPAAAPGPVTQDCSGESIPAGTTIGPYKLLQQIGEGGMGVVYMAEQSVPVQRRVALKIIKPGMDTRQVIARFEAERQALAMMEHPNIAKVFDAGTVGVPALAGSSGPEARDRLKAELQQGRPYFVMELVRGIPITKYCDEHHLTLRQRLELFLPVCQAVQHAHQKGIIHRDLKPTNVLVAQYDDKPVPKVIDFGVAKAAQKLTEQTMFTEFGQVVGTLEYMSPEQARLNQLDIDTRSDIYSLGVLLYELLTGCTPFDGKRLRSAAFDEMLRIIREEEPPKPSTKLSSAATLPSIAAHRNIEPARLGHTLRGELDWIVMKALEKDRNGRYETATGFAQDVQRYLSDETVHACPPSAAYRLRKFARRNRAAIATAVMIACALLLGLTGTTWQAVRATRAEGIARMRLEAERAARRETDIARQAAERDRLNAQKHEAVAVSEATKAKSTLKLLQEMLATGNTGGKDYTVRQMLDQFSGKLDQLSLNDSQTEAEIREIIGRTYRHLSCWKEGESHLRRAIALQRQLPGNEQSRIAKNLGICAWCVYAQGLHKTADDRVAYDEEGEALARESIALCGTSETDIRIHLNALRTIQHFTWISGKHEEADIVAREALALAGDRQFPELAEILHDLADSTTSRGRYPEAEYIARRALELNPPTTSDSKARAWAQSILARALVMQGKDEEGVTHAREALAIFRKYQPDSHYSVCGTLEPLNIVVARAQASALRSDWEQAALRYSQVVDAFPIGDISFHHACLRLIVGDDKGYQEFCTRLAADELIAHDPSKAYLAARICSVSTNSGVPLNHILDWAKRAIASDPKNARYMYALGAAYYRCDKLQDAIWELDKANETDASDAGQAQNRLLLAMAHHRLGNGEESRRSLQQARRTIQALRPESQDQKANIAVTDWLTLHVLKREAEALMGAASAGSTHPGTTVEGAIQEKIEAESSEKKPD